MKSSTEEGNVANGLGLAALPTAPGGRCYITQSGQKIEIPNPKQPPPPSVPASLTSTQTPAHKLFFPHSPPSLITPRNNDNKVEVADDTTTTVDVIDYILGFLSLFAAQKHADAYSVLEKRAILRNLILDIWDPNLLARDPDTCNSFYMAKLLFGDKKNFMTTRSDRWMRSLCMSTNAERGSLKSTAMVIARPPPASTILGRVGNCFRCISSFRGNTRRVRNLTKIRRTPGLRGTFVTRGS
mmetsp:Transcript_11952/g.26210  ORF Transcript_11952/g.26210 Transcript_11952/m.26210 type:complete len:241 (-) Transcript_11952:1253-1975(-)